MAVLRNPARDQRARAEVSVLIAQLTPELQGIVRTCRKALHEVGRARVERTRYETPRRSLRKRVSHAVAAHGLPAQAELRRDGAIAHALGAQFPHLLILCLAAVSALLAGSHSGRAWR